MADDKSFKELIQEQKQTNKLLMQQISSDERGSNLGQSIKNSAGEIINDVLIGNKQKRESDETQAIIKKTSDKALEENEEAVNEEEKKAMCGGEHQLLFRKCTHVPGCVQQENMKIK